MKEPLHPCQHCRWACQDLVPDRIASPVHCACVQIHIVTVPPVALEERNEYFHAEMLCAKKNGLTLGVLMMLLSAKRNHT